MVEYRASAGSSLGSAPSALLLTDGKMGDISQCRGVARALGAIAQEVTVSPDKLSNLTGLITLDSGFRRAIDAIDTPPKVLLASGRRTLPYLKKLRARWPQTVSVFLKDPRTGAQTADLIWVPRHDRLRGSNVIVTDTAPHAHTLASRSKAASALRARLARYPRPWLGVLLGGATKRVPYDNKTITALTQAISTAAQGAGSVIVTPSRRTPAELTEALNGLHPRTWIWDGSDANPYAGMLGACDAFFVTGDSHNMVSEALVAGRQTMVFRPAGLPGKFGRFLDHMQRQNLVVTPRAADFGHRQEPVDATPIIAKAIEDTLLRAG